MKNVNHKKNPVFYLFYNVSHLVVLVVARLPDSDRFYTAA